MDLTKAESGTLFYSFMLRKNYSFKQQLFVIWDIRNKFSDSDLD